MKFEPRGEDKRIDVAESGEIEDFLSAIKSGPSILFLGQDYLRLESGSDPFLSEVTRKYGMNSYADQYSQILEGDAKKSPENALAWMQGLSDRLSVPTWLKTVAEFAWSGIYSSAIDAIWPKAFRSDWRELYHIFDEDNNPYDIRSRSKLHCTYLFGNVNRSMEEEKAPLTQKEFFSRKQVAITLARRLPEILTPLGVLVIEGYAGERDWFKPTDLSPIIDKLNPKQTHIFSVTQALANDPIVHELVQDGKIILHEDKLALYLLKGNESGLIKLGPNLETEELGRRIRISDDFLTVPIEIWNRVVSSVIILDDAITITPPYQSQDKNYLEFRNFLAESGMRPMWSGFGRGFAFCREFEEEITKLVKNALNSNQLKQEPIILHGQTGTGKTVALSSLAYKIRRESKFPVLFIDRKPQLPSSSDIDSFCKWAEDSGAQATLIIWDGTFDSSTIGQYYDLLRYLIGRGRKVVLVGSCYRLESSQFKGKNFVEAPAQFTADETSKFFEYLKGIDPSIQKFLTELDLRMDHSYLVALYRLLPPTRSNIRSGINKEVINAQKTIEQLIRSYAPAIDNTLGIALVKAGVVKEEEVISGFVQNLDETAKSIEELIGLVMIPGRFGVKVPIELITRATRKKEFIYVSKILEQIDLVRVSEDEVGNIWVYPRHPLEAKLITQLRYGGAHGEINYILKLLSCVRGNDEQPVIGDIQFAVDLLISIGPNGQEKRYFLPYFLGLADTLKMLRKEKGVKNPRLMLQEATLLREYVIKKSQLNQIPANALEIFDEGESTLRDALKLLDESRKNTKMRSILLVELATTLGSKGFHLIEYLRRPEEATPLLQEAQKTILRARELDPNSYYPIDVMAWTTFEIVDKKLLDPVALSDAKAELLSIFEMTETEDFGFKQQERFLLRRMKVETLLDRADLSEEAFDTLVKMGSAAGYYFRAYDTVKDVPKNQELPNQSRKLCETAASYLEKNRGAIDKDYRCMYLLLHTWWKSKTGKPLFYHERQVVPFDDEDWRYVLGIVSDILSIEGFRSNPSLKYLLAISLFHLERYDDSLATFRELERESDYVTGRRRIVRSYLSSNKENSPNVFSGTVAWISANGARGEIYVDEIRRNIKFIPRDFNMPEVREKETFNRFYIAFNFLGPVVDPVSYYRPR